MKRAKSTRRVMLLSRMGIAHVPAPHGQAQTLALLRSLPRRRSTVCRCAKIRRAASTWSSRSAKRARRASGRRNLHQGLELQRVHVLPSRVMCHPHEKMSAPPEARSRAPPGSLPVEYPWTPRGVITTRIPSHPATARLMTSRSSVAPGMTVMRPLNAFELPHAFGSRHTPTTRHRDPATCWTMYCPSFPEPRRCTLSSTSSHR